MLYNNNIYNYIMYIYVSSNTKVKLKGLEVPFKNIYFGQKNNY